MRSRLASTACNLLLASIVALPFTAPPAKARQAATSATTPLLFTLPDGRRLAFQCSGTGSPTVIFDSGLGAGAQAWSRVQPRIAETARACAFDRPGYGASDEGPPPRDAAANVRDLRAGLQAAGIAGPYVLVGHSMGGYTMRLFAGLHPDEVAGMVLVDPSIDGNEAPLRAVSPAFARTMDEFQATAGKCIRAAAEGRMRAGDPIHAECGSPPPDSPMASASLARTALSEQAAMDASSRQVLAAQPEHSDLPLIVLTAGAQHGPQTGTPEAERVALMRVITDNHAAIAARSSAGRHIVWEDAPHMIQMAQPEAVIAAVLDILDEARAAPRPRTPRP